MTLPACVADYRALAKRRLPRLLFDYIDGGAYAEITLRRNVEAFEAIRLRQRVMRDVSNICLATEVFGEALSMPVVLAPVGLSGMYARRGEVQAARAAEAAGITSCLSTVSICSLEEVGAGVTRPPWFQLYMIKDRAYMADLLAIAREGGTPVLVFTVDLPMPGSRYREVRSGMTGGLSTWGRIRRAFDAGRRPDWLLDVYLGGRPHTFGNLVKAVPDARDPSEFWVWVKRNFDTAVTWDDLAWVRKHWPGPIVVKGIMDVEDARSALASGADGLVVSNHGGRQLDGVPASVEALPAIAEAVGDKMTVLVDGGIRSGLDVVKALALGAKACLIGRAWAYPLAARGGTGVAHMLELLRQETITAMALTGCTDVHKAGRDLLV